MIKIKGIKSVNLHGGKMKKKVGIISALLVIVIVIILAILLTNKKENKPLNFTTSDSSIAYYYQNGSGYTQGSSTAWSTGEYVLDIEDSKCNGNTNPEDIIDWNPSSNGVLLKANENVNCTLYFDIKPAQEKFFEKLIGQSGNGELLYHNSLLENGANDHGYRYSGDNPNNFICFGSGSESYNNGGTTCPNENLYRIIGYVPVELSNGTKTKLIKVIKSEYATHDDLGISSNGTPSSSATYKDLKRVKELPIDGFYWDDNNNNIWGSSSLYEALNDNSSGYLYNLNSWANKIEEVEWNVGGNPNDELPKAKEVYDDEWSSTYGAQTKVPAKIGLMYASDYGFASEPKSWEYRLYKYNNSKDTEQDENNQNRENNWLFNGVNEWTISRYSNRTGYAFNVYYYGYVDDRGVGRAGGVRPVFYLNSSVTLSDGNGIDGSVGKPYKVS